MNQPRLLRLTAISSLLWALLLGVGACSPFEPRAGVNDAGDVSDLLTVSRSGDADLVLSPGDKVVGKPHSQGTASNPLILLDSVRPGAHIFHEQPELTLKTTTIVSLNPADGSVRWARRADTRIDEVHYSPDMRHMAFVLHPDELSRGDGTESVDHSVEAQRMKISVLDTGTGREVRSAELPGVTILGFELTDTKLVVETSRGNAPAEDGTINVFSLDDALGFLPSTFPTDQWLVGATSDSVLLSPRKTGGGCMTLTRAGTGGEVLGVVPCVHGVKPGGWVIRFTNPRTAAEALAREETSTSDVLALPRELFNVTTGALIDVTGMSVDHVDLPDGPGLLLQKVTTTGEGKTTSTPAAWLSATPDSTQARTDDMTRLLLTPERISRKTVRMGEGET